MSTKKTEQNFSAVEALEDYKEVLKSQQVSENDVAVLELSTEQLVENLKSKPDGSTYLNYLRLKLMMLSDAGEL